MIKHRMFGTLFVVGVGVALATTCTGTASAYTYPNLEIYNDVPRLDAVFVEGSGYYPGGFYEVALADNTDPNNVTLIKEYTGTVGAGGILDVEFGDLPVGPYSLEAMVLALDPRSPAGETISIAYGAVD